MLEFDFITALGSFQLTARGSQAEPAIGLFGPTASGKTTFLNCLAGLLRPRWGFISLDGEVFFDSSKRRCIPPDHRAIGYVFQHDRLFPHMTVEHNIRYGRRRAPGPSIDELIEVFDLKPLLQRHPNRLSGGERQRVAVARALAAAPRLLLLDEPLASLDEASRIRILPYLAQVREKWRIPFIYVSHSLTEISFLARAAWCIADGTLSGLFRPEELLFASAPDSLESFRNIISGDIEEVRPECGYCVANCRGRRLRVRLDGVSVGDAVTLSLPAKDILLSLASPSALSARNALRGRILRLSESQNIVWAVVRAAAADLVVQLTIDAARELRLRPGLPVYVVFKSHSVTVTTTKPQATGSQSQIPSLLHASKRILPELPTERHRLQAKLPEALSGRAERDAI